MDHQVHSSQPFHKFTWQDYMMSSQSSSSSNSRHLKPRAQLGGEAEREGTDGEGLYNNGGWALKLWFMMDMFMGQIMTNR